MRNNIPFHEITIWCHAATIFHNVEERFRLVKSLAFQETLSRTIAGSAP
jgi:hypothetical protein